MKTLVHYDVTGEAPLGLWWVNASDEPQSLYLDDASPEAARWKIVVFSKTDPEVPWVLWFDRLTERAPYFEIWRTYNSNGFSPEEMLESLRRAATAAS